jgi:hypothetical protein
MKPKVLAVTVIMAVLATSVPAIANQGDNPNAPSGDPEAVNSEAVNKDGGTADLFDRRAVGPGAVDPNSNRGSDPNQNLDPDPNQNRDSNPNQNRDSNPNQNRDSNPNQNLDPAPNPNPPPPNPECNENDGSTRSDAQIRKQIKDIKKKKGKLTKGDKQKIQHLQWSLRENCEEVPQAG